MLHSYAPQQIARQQLAILQDEGVDMKKVVVGHANDTQDMEYLTWIAAETGRELRFETESAQLYAQTYMLDGDPSGFTPAALLEIIERSSRLEEDHSLDERTMLIRLRDIR